MVVLPIAVLALAGAANAAGSDRSSELRVPTLLWKTYPLVQRPAAASSRVETFAAGPPAVVPLHARPGGYGPSQTLLLVLLGSLTAAVWGVLLVRSALAEATEEAARARHQEEERPEATDLLVALRPGSDDEQPERPAAPPAPRQLEPEPEPPPTIRRRG